MTAATNPHGLTNDDLLTLLALSVGNAFDVADGALYLTDPVTPGSPLPVATDTLDRLEAAAMIEIREAGAELTDRGRYHLARWMERHRKKGRVTA